MFKKIGSFVSMLVCGASIAVAQTPQCSTDEHYQELKKKYPQLVQYEEAFGDQISKAIKAKTTAVPDTATIDVPIVIHVIHDYSNENLSDDALYVAANYWAKVFVKQNADTIDVIPPFVKYAGNSRIRLHLATIDPQGRPTKGIDRVNSYLAYVGDDQAKYNQWPQNKYVNIWLIGKFGGSVGAGVIAYATPPPSAMYDPNHDGVICLYSHAGSADKSVPHEIGHVFNLSHTWGNNNNPAVACGDDNVDDTPPTLGHWNYGCVPSTLYDTTCATGYKKMYLSSTGLVDSLVDYPDTANSQNIMDYTDCQKMFSIGQGVRMRKALNSATGGRNNLGSPANLAATGALAPMPDLAPKAEFIVDRTTSGTGIDKRTYFLAFNSPAPFIFHNESWNDTVSDVHWTFSNGPTTPTSTSMTTVNNNFSVPGWVSVSLVANSNAGTDTLVNTHAVYAADTAVAGTLNYSNNFSDEPGMSNWPMFNYYNNQFKWGFYNGAGLGDNACIRYHSFDTSARNFGIAIGDHDDIYSPAFNLSETALPVYFNFFSSGAYTYNGVGTYDPHQGDSLEIDATINGGVQWRKVAGFSGVDLANNGILNSEFAPTNSNQWRARSILLPTIYNTPNTYFRFRYWPGNMGNDLYIDNFSLSLWPAGVKEVLTSTGSFDLYPNPTDKGCTLVFKTGNSGNVSYMITDITGKVVYSNQKQYASDSIHQEEIERSVLPTAGMYFVTITIDGMNTTKKLVVY